MGDIACQVVSEEPPPAPEGKTANFVLVLDTSGSVESQLTLMKNAVNDLLTKIGATDAQDVRVHIVEFGDMRTWSALTISSLAAWRTTQR